MIRPTRTAAGWGIAFTDLVDRYPAIEGHRIIMVAKTAMARALLPPSETMKETGMPAPVSADKAIAARSFGVGYAIRTILAHPNSS